MPLDEIRKARQMTRTKLAETLDVNQGEISKIEHRTDIYISTLAGYVEALGGKLEIRAIFPTGRCESRNSSSCNSPRLYLECRFSRSTFPTPADHAAFNSSSGSSECTGCIFAGRWPECESKGQSDERRE